MKPTNLLKNLKTAGVLASCILLVHCAPSDKKDAQVTKLSEDMLLPACSDETMGILRARSTLFGSIRDILSHPTLDASQKEKVQGFIEDVFSKSTSVVAKIRSEKVNGLPASGCKYQDPASNAQIKYQLGVIRTEDRALAKKVSEANDNKPNQILTNIRPTWSNSTVLEISPALAQLLSDATLVNGSRVIINGRIAAGGSDYQALKRNLTASFCVAASVDGQPVDNNGARASIGNLAAPRLDNLNRITVDLTLLLPSSFSGNRSFLLTCTLADASDINDAMVDTFGNLLKIPATSELQPTPGLGSEE